MQFGYLNPDKFPENSKIRYTYKKQERIFVVPENIEAVEYKDLFLLTSGEERVVKKILREVIEKRFPGQDITDLEPRDFVNVVNFDAVAPQLKNAPIELGRNACKNFNDFTDVLGRQTDELKKKNKDLYRVAIVQGFGTGLGDSFTGLNAYCREVLPRLYKELGTPIETTIILSPRYRQDVLDLYDVFNFKTYNMGISLEEFCSFDGFFDFSNLVLKPHFQTIPWVHWYLFWMGMDCRDIRWDKQNTAHLPLYITTYAQTFIDAIDASKVNIFLNTQASTALRSMPGFFVEDLSAQLLRIDPDINIISADKTEQNNPRIIDVKKLSYNALAFQAFISQCDLFVGVDSLAQHVSNACNIPSLVFLTTYRAERYDYYKTHTIATLPEVDKLPFFQFSNPPNPEAWEKYSETYHRAWKRLNLKEILKKWDIGGKIITIKNKKAARIP